MFQDICKMLFIHPPVTWQKAERGWWKFSVLTWRSEVTKDFSYPVWAARALAASPGLPWPLSVQFFSSQRIISSRHVSFTEPQRSSDSVGAKSRKTSTQTAEQVVGDQVLHTLAPRERVGALSSWWSNASGWACGGHGAPGPGPESPAEPPAEVDCSLADKAGSGPSGGVSPSPEWLTATGEALRNRNGKACPTSETGSPWSPQTSLEMPASGGQVPGEGPSQPCPPPARAPCALPQGGQEEGREGLGEPSASLHRPCRREGGSWEGATQTVALGKLRWQFFQVCPNQSAGWAPGSALRLRLAAAPECPGLPGRPGLSHQLRGRRAREQRQAGARVLPCVHTMRQRRRTPSPAGEAAGASAAQLGDAESRRAVAESGHQLSNRGKEGGAGQPGGRAAAEGCSQPLPRARAYLRSPGRGCPPGWIPWHRTPGGPLRSSEPSHPPRPGGTAATPRGEESQPQSKKAWCNIQIQLGKPHGRCALHLAPQAESPPEAATRSLSLPSVTPFRQPRGRAAQPSGLRSANFYKPDGGWQANKGWLGRLLALLL